MDLIQAMQGWCDAADEVARGHASTRVPTETKQDGTPVTAADREIETLLRRRIAADAPGETVVGEEEGGSLPTSGACWILDPIDGTKNFARGIPVFATLIARWEDGALTHAMVSAPALGRRWWADPSGAFCDGEPMQVSSVSDLAEADVCTGGLDWAARAGASVDALVGIGRRHRGFGDFWGYMLVAQGSMDAMVEYAPLSLWDIAAPRCIVERAGGRVTDHAGGSALQGGLAVATNGLLHERLISSLNG